jgi:electron transport complex protein RnfG
MTAAHQHGAPAAVTPSKSTPAWRLLVTLALAGAMSGWLVVSVYKVTLPAVQKHAAEQMRAAVYEVLKAPARWDTLYLVNDALTRSAPAAEPGFQELVTLMIGFDPASGTLIGFKVLDEKETPGLGDKIERDTAFGGQFTGRVAPLTGVKGRAGTPPSEVQTITGATISSRAAIRIINNAVAKWRPLLDAWDREGAK